MIDEEWAEGILAGITSATGLESHNYLDWPGTEMCFSKHLPTSDKDTLTKLTNNVRHDTHDSIDTVQI